MTDSGTGLDHGQMGWTFRQPQVLDPETDSIAQDAEHGDDEEEDGGEDDDEDFSGDSEGVPQLAGLMEKLAGLDRQGTLDMLDVLRDY